MIATMSAQKVNSSMYVTISPPPLIGVTSVRRGAPRSESKIAMIAGGNHTTIFVRCPFRAVKPQLL